MTISSKPSLILSRSDLTKTILLSLAFFYVEIHFSIIFGKFFLYYADNSQIIAKDTLVIFFVLGLFRAILGSLQVTLHVSFQEKIKTKIRTILVNTLRSRDIRPSEVLTDYTDNCDQAGAALLNFTFFVSNLIVTSLLFISLLYLNTPLTLIGILLLSPVLIIHRLSETKNIRLSQEAIQLWDHSFLNLTHLINNQLLIKISGIHEKLEKDIFEKMRNRSRILIRQQSIQSIRYTLPQIFAVIFLILLVLFSKDKEISLIMFSYLFLRFSQFGSLTSQNFATWQSAQPYLKKIEPIFSYLLPSTSQDTNIKNLVEVPIGWNFKDLNFKYQNQKNIFQHDISGNIEPGKFYVIHGPSGSGKTTFLKLLLGLHQATSGSINAFWSNNNGLNPSEIYDLLIANISYVGPDNFFLFEKTIKSNILLGLEERPINDDDIWKLIERVELKDTIIKRGGLDAMINNSENSFSSGQLQRISIVRALLRSPKALILDEALSHVDNDTEVIIIKLLKSLNTQMTIISTSHKESWRDIADENIALFS